MKPRFQIFVNLPGIDPDTGLEGIDSTGKTVLVTFRDILRTVVFHEDPEDSARTVISNGNEKFSINMDKRKFESLLSRLEKDELFRTLSLN